ncbi:MAG: PEP-CTERM sorting domain-containing protein [Deltaproteobacteria bacterium]|nr:PEP-CTERM sorting domain-containing protein [Deltaproteobacteria bacterium]
MKKVLGCLIALILILGFAEMTWASPITFTDTTQFYANHTDPAEDLVSYGGDFVNELEWFRDHVKWTHHFDFVPPAAKVLSGTLTVWLRDDGDNCCLFPWEFGFGWAEDGTWDFGEVDTGDYSYNVTASYLEDGEFTISLWSKGGDFYIDKSELEITYNPVPVPATLLLLGSGLIGLANFRKRFKK